MKSIYNIKKYLSLVLASLLLGACGDFFDINQDPNNPTEADLDQLLPASQLAIAATFAGDRINQDAAIWVQHYYDLSVSRFDVDGSDYSSSWSDFYASGMRDMENILATAEAEGLLGYLGIAQIQKAYVYGIFVDVWGDIPYSQASLGADNTSPAFDPQREIYLDLFNLIDQGITNLEAAVVVPINDLFYGGDFASWIRAGNTLKMKMYNQIRLVEPAMATSGINDILADGRFIDDNSEDFQFLFGSGITPINQHPLYIQGYTAGDIVHFQSNYMINTMLNTFDPRLRYYMYRQFLSDPTGADLPCDAIPCFYGYQGDGYIGRDHGDPSIIPNDQDIRTTFGVYPYAGLYDDDSEQFIEITSNTGAGIHIMLTNFMVKFILAEAGLTLGVNTGSNPRTLMEQGIRAQMDKVINFGAANDRNAPLPNDPQLQLDIDGYVSDRLAEFDAANSDQDRLRVIITEKHKALFGNGYEAFNDYRRTGFPLFINQQTQDGSTVSYPNAQNMAISPLSAFPRSFLYPTRELETNGNAPNQKNINDPVWWDNNN